MKKRSLTLLTFCAVASWALGPGLASAGEPVDASGAAGRCTLAGTWYGESSAGFAFLITVIPIDNAHSRFVAVADADANPPGASFPGAVEATAFHSSVVRTGLRTFAQTALSYARDEASWIATYHVAGAWELTEDCDTAEVRWESGAFLFFQDPFADQPIGCLAVTGTYRRIPVAASPCPEP